MMDNTQRFSNRVDNYVQYRPRYPSGVFESLQTICQLSERSIVADIGSGTGFLAEGFLRLGFLVYGVEPNRQMRQAGEQLLQDYPGFRSIVGTAEETTLPAASADLVAAGQSFHWFEPARAKREFQRVLKPAGWVALVWNEWRGATYPLGADYDNLLKTYATDFARVTHKQLDDQELKSFLGTDFLSKSFENSQTFDFDGLKGRLLSSSYAPEAGQPGHELILSELRKIFDAHQVDGHADFLYETKLYCGRLG